MVKNTRKNNKSTRAKNSRKQNPQKGNFKKEIVSMFLKMLNTTKLYHWRTYSYATHEATDNLYADLNKYVDEFVEVMMGKMDNRNKILNIHLVKMNVPNNNNDFKKEIEYYKNFLLANKAGVNFLAYRCKINTKEILVEKKLKIISI